MMRTLVLAVLISTLLTYGTLASAAGHTNVTTALRTEASNLAAASSEFRVSMRSLFIRSQNAPDELLTMLVIHSEHLSALAQQTMGRQVTPLIFSVSTLPSFEASFDPSAVAVEQGGKFWQPAIAGVNRDLFALCEGITLGGRLTASQVQHCILLLPEWIDTSRPFSFVYGDVRRTIMFGRKYRYALDR